MKENKIFIILGLVTIAVVGGMLLSNNMPSPSSATTGVGCNGQPVTAASASTVINMNAQALDFAPNCFVVPANKEITWNITNDGAFGCTQYLIARGLIPQALDLGVKGDVKTVKFTLPRAGSYAFSCSMNMVTGRIIAV